MGNLARANVLAKSIDPLVDLAHEFVEVGTALVLDRALLKEHIHQHGLATPDLAVNVEAARGRVVLVGKQPAEQSLLARRLVARKPLLDAGKGFRNLFLRGVGLDRAGGNEGLIMGAERGGGERQHGPSYGPKLTKIARLELVQGLCVPGVGARRPTSKQVGLERAKPSSSVRSAAVKIITIASGMLLIHP